jgi:hypothetical protein
VAELQDCTGAGCRIEAYSRLLLQCLLVNFAEGIKTRSSKPTVIGAKMPIHYRWFLAPKVGVFDLCFTLAIRINLVPVVHLVAASISSSHFAATRMLVRCIKVLSNLTKTSYESGELSRNSGSIRCCHTNLWGH